MEGRNQDASSTLRPGLPRRSLSHSAVTIEGNGDGTALVMTEDSLFGES